MQQLNKYKRTEIGQLPEEWKVQSISDNSVLKGRIGWQGLTTAEYRHKGEYYLVTGTDFKNGKIDWKNCVYIDKNRYVQDENIQLERDDVLVTKDGTIGKIAYVDLLPRSATLNTGVFVIRPIDKAYFPLFLYYVLCSDYFVKFLNKLKAGSTINHLYQKDFLTFRFPVPPYPEQQKIASILAKVDELIQKTDQIIEQTQRLKKGIMERILLQGIRHLRHKPVGFGPYFLNYRIPYEWQVLTLDKCVRGDTPVTYGIVQAGPHVPEGVPYIRTGDMSQDKLSINGMLRTSREIASLFVRSTVKAGEIVCALRGIVGKVLEVPEVLEGANLTQGTARISPRPDIHSRYLLWALQSEYAKRQFEIFSKGTTLNEITLERLRKIKVAIPADINEQKSIAHILDHLELAMGLQSDYKEKLGMLKLGLMQKLLSGKIRVKI